MKNTTRTLMVLAAAFVCIASTLTAQNTIIPAPLQSYKPNYWNSDVFSASVPTFALGHQWGGAALDKINTAFKMNVTGGNWGYLHLNEKELYKLGKGYKDTNYVVWAAPLMHTTEGWIGEIFRVNWYGMRWEPAENPGIDNRDWQARDADAWPLSFGARHHGTVPSSPSDVNYRRFKLDPAGMPSNPVRVLDSVEPRNLMRMWYYDDRVRAKVKWENYLGFKFAKDSTNTGGTWSYTYYEDSTDGRRLQLVVNLRRTDATDTILDDQPVVSITVPYQLRWKDQQDTNPNFRSDRFKMPFTLVPWNTKDSTFALPRGRGLEMKTRAPAGFTDSIVITRRMLPRHSDPGGPDVTIVAEFRTDTIMDDLFGAPTRRPHMLKSGVTDYPAFFEHDSTLGIVGTSAPANKRYRAIDSLGITVWYHGNSAVAIRSASLLTPITKRATSGYHDSLWASKFEDHRVRIKIQIDTLRSRIGRHTRVLAFYTNDEFEMDQLLGMRYKAEFLDRRLTSETGYIGSRFAVGNTVTEYGRQKMQGFPTKFPWTAGLTQPTRATSAPYISRGSVGEEIRTATMPVPSPIMSIKSGFLWTGDNAPYRRFETDISTKTTGTWAQLALPFPTTPFDFTSLTAYEDMMHSNMSQVGPAAMQEHSVYVNMYQNAAYYFGKRKNFWMNFFYHIDPKFGYDSSGRAYVRYNNFQPLIGESVRLGHGTALNLGTRGFMYDKWKYQDSPDYLIPHPDSVRSPDKYGSENIISDSYFPGYVTEDPTSFVMDTTSSVTPEDLLLSEHIGGDYYTVGERININDWTPFTTLASEMRLDRIIPGDVTKKVYAGRLSVRWETKWWHDLVTDTVTRFKRSTDISNAELFMKSRPVGWYGHGYRTLIGGDTTRLRQWVTAYSGVVGMQRWARTSNADTTLRLETEPEAERLYDIVLLDTAETGASDEDCIISITNRRTSPFLFNNAMPDSVQFITSYEHDTLTRGSRPDLRYQQVGARRITLPLNYTVDVTKPYLLHVRELRPAYDGALTLDTIVNGKSNLALDLRPGDVRFFRIKRLQAIDTTNTGYLAFSTQNKMVAYRIPKADFSGYTDSIRYHAVFHRRDTDPMRTGPWTVYYQRSKAYHRDSLPLVSGLDWETPIRLSRLTTSSVQNTDGLNRTLYYDVNPVAYLANVPPMTNPQKDCSCGFPSIVVREVVPNRPKVHIVYTCEDEWIPTGFKFNFAHIVENAFLDNPVLNPALLDANGKSLVIIGKGGPHDGGMDTLKSLARWGTPVINASAEGRMYYAWSAVGAGIGAGTKSTGLDWFPAANAITAIPTPTITWHYAHDDIIDTIMIDGGAPRYPSLNVYSNIAQGRTDATLVWEEGTMNRHIRYTRLVPGLGMAIGRMLPLFAPMSYAPGRPPTIPGDGPNSIAVIGGALPEDEAETPVVLRSLQRDTMSMFIRDTDGSPNGLYRYNHETVAWSEYSPWETRNRIKYNHLIDMQGFGLDELHYWWTNTTYSLGNSLFHPVITNGSVRMDSLTWQGVVDDSLITYGDSLHIVRGNISDSAVIVNYSVLDTPNFSDLYAQKQYSYASYWTGHRQFPNIRGQQIMVRRMPGVPAPPTVLLDVDYLRAPGPWPHLAMRQREDTPIGIQSVRRILQYTNDNAPKLVASAEQFYKVTDAQEEEPVVSGGVEVQGRKLTARAVLADGRTLSFRPVYDDVMPNGYGGSMDYAWQMASMTKPVTDLVTESFTVGDVDEMKLVATGGMRGNVDVSIEEVQPDVPLVGGRTMTDFRSMRSVRMGLAEADQRKPDAPARSLFYLTGGDEKIYRLRMKYTGDGGIFREDLDITPEKESFGKTAEAARIIDLNAMRGTDATTEGLHIYPNPARERVTIIVGGPASSGIQGRTLTMDIVGALGNVVMTTTVASHEAVDVVGLPSGVYSVRVRMDGGVLPVTIGTGKFTVVK